MNELLPPMIKCCDCIYSKPYYDKFIGGGGYRCNKMQQIGEFGDEYSLQNTACVEGIKKGDCPSINSKVVNNHPNKTPKGLIKL